MKWLIVSDKKKNDKSMSVKCPSFTINCFKNCEICLEKKIFCVLVYKDITIFSCNYFVSPAKTSVKES